MPGLCLFDTPDSIAAMEFVKDEDNSVFVPNTQPTDEGYHEFLTEAVDTELEIQKIADAAPKVEQKVYVYDFGPSKDPLFSLTASQVDGTGSSWCNMNSFRNVKSGGLSGEKDGVDDREMNDISCFSDCVDISNMFEVDISNNTCETFNPCVTIESGRKLFQASPAPFTRSDAIKYKVTDSTLITSYSADDDNNTDGSSSSTYIDDDEDKEIKLSKKKNKETKRNTCPRGIYKFMLNNTPQEESVLEKLVNWSEKKQSLTIFMRPRRKIVRIRGGALIRPL